MPAVSSVLSVGPNDAYKLKSSCKRARGIGKDGREVMLHLMVTQRYRADAGVFPGHAYARAWRDLAGVPDWAAGVIRAIKGSAR
jgi:hypothetical protein